MKNYIVHLLPQDIFLSFSQFMTVLESYNFSPRKICSILKLRVFHTSINATVNVIVLVTYKKDQPNRLSSSLVIISKNYTINSFVNDVILQFGDFGLAV